VLAILIYLGPKVGRNLWKARVLLASQSASNA
jgi:hypothetical protein